MDSKLIGFIMAYDLVLNPNNRYSMPNKVSFASGIRKYYPTSGILVCRPHSGTGISATFKLLGGGLNPGGGHNHDDAGSFQLLKNGIRVAGDIGGVPYSGNWADRYNGWIYNSFSHPVPVVNGQLQKRNTIYNLNEPRPKVISTSFSDDVDVIVYDLKAAYDSTAIVSLQRTNTYYRTTGGESVAIRDHVVYSTPTKCEIAISSRGTWTETSLSSTILTGVLRTDTEIINVKVISANPFTYKKNVPTENGVTYTRLGIVITNLSLSETVTVTYS